MGFIMKTCKSNYDNTECDNDDDNNCYKDNCFNKDNDKKRYR